MRSAIRLKQLTGALLPVFALICAVRAAAAGAHGARHGHAEVVVKGVVTTAPINGSGSFTATAYVVAPPHFYAGGHGHGGRRHRGHGWGGGKSGSGTGKSGSGKSSGTGRSSGTSKSSSGTGGGSSKGSGFSYTYSGKVRGHASSARVRGSRCLPGSTHVSHGTAGTVITTDGSTAIKIDGRPSSAGSLAVGDYFTAVYAGTPDESLSTITSAPALAVSVFAPVQADSLYAFVGTVSSTDTTTGTVTVNVTGSTPNGLFSGTDTFDVGSQTIVLGNSGGTLFGSLTNVAAGDVVAGGLIAPSGESASTVESTALGVLVDFPQSSSSSSSSTSAQAEKASIRRAERRAVKLLRREKAKHGHHKK
jgi:hypothetical protein